MKRSKFRHPISLRASLCSAAILLLVFSVSSPAAQQTSAVRERLSFNSDWRFIKDDPEGTASKLAYTNIKAWVMATGNEFTTNSQPPARPEGNPGADVSYTQPTFNDSSWRRLNLPHDWGIEGPFKQESPGGTGRLPWSGVAWYRKHFDVPAADAGRRLYLSVDGAMAYANVWLNGQYVGGWPYGYASWQVDLTPYVKYGGENVIAIRLDNPPNSSRWYPGGGIYRNVWLEKTSPVHVSHWGTYVTTPEASRSAATVRIRVNLNNDSASDATVLVKNEIYELDARGNRGKSVASLTTGEVKVAPHNAASSGGQIRFSNPRLWSIEKPQRYVVITSVEENGKFVDRYETPFGIRTLKFDPNEGFLLNGERVRFNGVCDHHDLGALGSAINTRALERQLEILKEMGCNAIRTSHNPPAPELLDLCDRMGFVVMDESFDCWLRGKTPNDYHLLFADWHEKDQRALIRRDRNHPSVVMWSIGNEVGEQTQGERGAAVARELASIVHQEDPTRPTTSAENSARAGSPFAAALDVLGLNYQGSRLPTPQTLNSSPQYPNFKQSFPTNFIYGSETASTISSRGEYTFPVVPVGTNTQYGTTSGSGPGRGEDVPRHQMSSYDLYFPNWATSPDMEFAAQDRWPYVGGEFVWTGFDYLGEPTPWGGRNDPSRSSYFGIIDLAGLKKDRFYLYQARWHPDLPMAHILPHWNWPDRVGQVTPVHVYTSGDEAELFLNGKSLGRKKKGQYEYRLRWDNVVYQPGELKIIAYKNGKKWASDVMKTAGPASKLLLEPDRNRISADGQDLSFVTVTIADKSNVLVPHSMNHVTFTIEGPGEIVATDNGDATSFESFQSPERNAFNGLALVIVRGKPGMPGTIRLTAKSGELNSGSAVIKTRAE